MSGFTIEEKKQRFDDTYKVLLTILTLLLSTAITVYRGTSPENAIFLFLLYSISIVSWCAGHLLGGDFEYFLKFIGWFALLGGIFEVLLVLYVGTFIFNSYYYALNGAFALFVFYIVFRYVRSFLDKSNQKLLNWYFLFASVLVLVLCSLKFMGLF